MREINNRLLLDGKSLASNVREKVDYFVVNHRVWSFILKLYGGGP
jgi:hypothetical protein